MCNFILVYFSVPQDGFLLGCWFAISDYPEQMADKQLLATWKRVSHTIKRNDKSLSFELVHMPGWYPIFTSATLILAQIFLWFTIIPPAGYRSHFRTLRELPITAIPCSTTRCLHCCSILLL